MVWITLLLLSSLLCSFGFAQDDDPHLPSRIALNGLTRQKDLVASPFLYLSPIVVSWVPGDTKGEHASNALTSPIQVTVSEECPYCVEHTLVWSFSGEFKRSPSFQIPKRILKKMMPKRSYAMQLRHNNDTSWSQPLVFDIAPEISDWDKAEWVGGASQLRSEILLAKGKEVGKARAYASGLGAFQLHVNGGIVGDHIMDPGESVYDQKVLYVGFDVTPLLQPGKLNVFGAVVGNSKFGYLDIYANRSKVHDQSGDSTRAFIMLCVVTYKDGSEEMFTTTSDSSSPQSTWMARHGPIVYDHLWHGEIFDHRLTIEGWDAGSLQRGDEWAAAKKMVPVVGELVPQQMPPIRITETLLPVHSRCSNDACVFDFGLNFAGLTALTFSIPSSKISATIMLRLKHTEILGENGEPFNNYYPGMEHNGASKTCSMSDWYEGLWYECANQTDAIIISTLNSTSAQELVMYSPTFTYHGFRFVELTAVEIGADGREMALSLELENAFPFGAELVAHRAHSDIEKRTTIDFTQPESSPGRTQETASLLEKLFNATINSHTSNLWSIPTDCPQREKRGWMADAGISSLSLQEFFDSFAFHANFLRRIVDNQRKGCTDQPTTNNGHPCQHQGAEPAAQWFNGSVPDVVPFPTPPYGGNPGTVDWQAAFIMIGGNMLKSYGKERTSPLLNELWPHYVSLMDYYERNVDKGTGLLLQGARGDWVPPVNTAKPTGAEPTAAFFHTLCVQYMSEIATAIGRSADAARYSKRLTTNRKAYHSKFYNKTGKSCCYGSGSQTNNIYALYIHAVPTKSIEDETVQALVSAIHFHNKSVDDSRVVERSVSDESAVAPVPPWGDGPHLDMGIFGTTFVFDVLKAHGLDDLGFQILNRTDYPSLGYMIAQGSTTLWEGWTGTRNLIGEATSRNHIMFGGGVIRFLATQLVGLPSNAHDDGVLTISPAKWAIENLYQMSGTRDMGRGRVGVAWARAKNQPHTLELNVSLPSLSAAHVRLPASHQCENIFVQQVSDRQGTVLPLPKVDCQIERSPTVTYAILQIPIFNQRTHWVIHTSLNN